MRDLDDVDRTILRLLIEDARRPYSDIAEHVDLSAPAVSDRVDRLHDLGVIRGFTADVDRSLLRDGVPVLVELDPPPAAADEVRTALRGLDRVEHVFVTAEGDVIFRASVPEGDVRGLLDGAIDLDRIRNVAVRLLDDSDWTPSLGIPSLALTCAECDNTVTSEGESARIGGELRHFCCESCLANFEERYERLERDA